MKMTCKNTMHYFHLKISVLKEVCGDCFMIL